MKHSDHSYTLYLHRESLTSGDVTILLGHTTTVCCHGKLSVFNIKWLEYLKLFKKGKNLTNKTSLLWLTGLAMVSHGLANWVSH